MRRRDFRAKGWARFFDNWSSRRSEMALTKPAMREGSSHVDILGRVDILVFVIIYSRAKHNRLPVSTNKVLL